ncbi:MAG: hypothetical protein Q8N99_03370 [Nanoarchaeota archaeon]|nr:hypothetical protein [Nanoarchaeota archaeon]
MKKRKNKRGSKRGDKDFQKNYNRFNNKISRIEKELDIEVKKAEKWVIERRKFFFKLGIVALLIITLLIISELFMKVKGAGI